MPTAAKNRSLFTSRYTFSSSWTVGTHLVQQLKKLSRKCGYDVCSEHRYLGTWNLGSRQMRCSRWESRVLERVCSSLLVLSCVSTFSQVTPYVRPETGIQSRWVVNKLS